MSLSFEQQLKIDLYYCMILTPWMIISLYCYPLNFKFDPLVFVYSGLMVILMLFLERMRMLWAERGIKRYMILEVIFDLGVAPILEEIIFRNFFIQLFLPMGIGIALVFSTTLFTIPHFISWRRRRNRLYVIIENPVGKFGYYFLFGISQGLIFISSGFSFYNVWMSHFLTNALIFIRGLITVSKKHKISVGTFV